MSKILLLLLAIRTFAVDFAYEGDLFQGKGPLFVSLGSHCEVALTLRNAECRNAAFPFDWLVVRDHDKLIKILDEDFLHFTDEAYFVPVPNELHSVRNTYYELIFHHEWPFSDDLSDPLRYSQQLEAIQVKYARRIARFRQLRETPSKVFFIRNPFWEEGGTSKQIEELKNALLRYFPSLDFTLVIISYLDQSAPDISEIDRVIAFQINRPTWEEEYPLIYKLLME